MRAYVYRFATLRYSTNFYTMKVYIRRFFFLSVTSVSLLYRSNRCFNNYFSISKTDSVYIDHEIRPLDHFIRFLIIFVPYYLSLHLYLSLTQYIFLIPGDSVIGESLDF